MKSPIRLFLTALFAGLLITSCSVPEVADVTQAPVVVTEEPMPAETEVPVEPEATEELVTEESPGEPEPEMGMAWNADGVVSEGEYSYEADLKGFKIWWSNDAEFLYMALEGKTKGWVSVGIDPENRMQGANYIFGYVVDGTAQIWDAYGTAPTGATHPPDEELGGANHIVAFAGVEENSVTRFEFQIPLDSGDDYDKPLVSGQSYPMIVATGGADDYNGYHSMYAKGDLIID